MRGATLRAKGERVVAYHISIHAPHAGRDVAEGDEIPFTKIFQSTRPMRGATMGYRTLFLLPEFQSTRPMRGATSSTRPGVWIAKFQSTRPMRGATTFFWARRITMIFQSTRPMRGATSQAQLNQLQQMAFQSTRPMRGATRRGNSSAAVFLISIHAPHAGRDTLNLPMAQRSSNFNPRAPCGARLHLA